MEQRLNCQIVQDLLPNYIDGLTSDLTNKAVQDHLASCGDCRRVLESMTTETRGIRVAPPKQINFLKKIKRKQWRTASFSVFVAVIILLGGYYLFGTRNFPVPASDAKISEVYQMQDGTIHYRVTVNVKGYVGHVTTHSNRNTETYRIFERRKLFSADNDGIVTMPEKWSSVANSNSTNKKTAIYYEGIDKSDKITIWENGMTIPKATPEQEAAYRKHLEE